MAQLLAEASQEKQALDGQGGNHLGGGDDLKKGGLWWPRRVVVDARGYLGISQTSTRLEGAQSESRREFLRTARMSSCTISISSKGYLTFSCEPGRRTRAAS